MYCYIKSCNNLQIYEGDGLPTLICQQCCHEVDRSYKFKMKCETSDATLKQYTRKSPVNSEDEIVVEVTQYLHCYFSFIVNKNVFHIYVYITVLEPIEKMHICLYFMCLARNY